MRGGPSRCALMLVSILGVSCGGSSGGGARPSRLIQVAGTYDIHKAFLEDTCGDGLQGQAFTNQGTVSHTPGAARFVLTDHGTRTLPGSVNPDGTFTLDDAPGIAHGTIPALDTFANGRFTTAGFQVRNVTQLEATATTAACQLVSQWDATKVGAPNVIP